MFGYKCDHCGAVVYVDPSEERICAHCEAERERDLRELVEVTCSPKERVACHAV